MKKITMTDKQKRILISILVISVTASGSYICLRKFLRSETAADIEEALIDKLIWYHVNTHHINFFSLSTFYDKELTRSVGPKVVDAIQAVVTPVLEGGTTA